MSFLPPNPSLVAIILLVKTKQGVKHIYHYPPRPGHDNSTRTGGQDDADSSDSDSIGKGYSSDGESADSSVEDSFSSSSNNDPRHRSDRGKDDTASAKRRSARKATDNIDESGSTSPEKNSIPEWRATKGHKELLGLPPEFPTFLCPPTVLDRRRFEMGIDQLTFLGWPCFAKGDGTWKTKRKRKRDEEMIKNGSAQNGQTHLDLQHGTAEDVAITTDDQDHTTQDETSEVEHVESASQQDIKANDPSDEQVLADSKNKTDTTSSNHETHQGLPISMFHVVFVMNPPPLEYQVRVDDMYGYVVKNFSKALKREQARSNYVSKECQKLKDMKARHDPDSKNVFRKSRLAKAIATLYNNISNSRIAHIDLTSHRSLWLHIPTPTSISSLPGPTEPQLPGTWLTTSTMLPNNDELSSSNSKLASNFALLLLSDIPTILMSISESSRLRPALEHYLTHSTPTKSFLKVSQKASIPLDDITIMASHLIHWRQARIIPPLHKKDIYIVSPNADMKRLRTAAVQFHREFPIQPSLTTILSRLNSSTRPWKSLIPNKDHKEAYMNILAWLMKGGWVTQIRTFAWVRVPGDIQRYIQDVEQKEKASAAESEVHPEYGDYEDGYLSIPIHKSRLSTPSLHSSASSSSALTTIPHPSGQPGPSSSTPAILIPSPTKTSGQESRYLDHIAHLIEVSDGPDAREAWTRCLPFFDGEHALESIPSREGWKRKYFDGLVHSWVERGLLRTGRGW